MDFPRVEITVWFLHEGISQAIVLHYIADPLPVSQAEVDDLAESYSDLFAPILKTLITTECTFNGITARFVGGDSGWVSDNLSNIGAGVVTGDTCPGEVSAIIRKVGSGPAKRAHGTIFFPCVPESFTEDSRLTSTARTTYFNGLVTLLSPSAMGPSDLQLCVWSRVAHQLYPTTAIQVMTIMGHQRRRRPRR